VESAMLAHAGFTASPDIVECSLGYGDTLLGHAEYEPAKIVAELGGPFLVEGGVSIKKYACCYCNHATLDGMFTILAEHDLNSSDVVSIQVTGSSILRDPLIFTHPASGLQGKFSLPYNIALALVDRRTSLSSYSDEHIRDPRLAEAIDKVTIVTPEGWAPRRRVRIEIMTTSGERIVHDQGFVDGDETHPLSWEAIIDKFRDTASIVLGKDAIDRTIALVEVLESQSSIQPLTGALADLIAA
jgi:2-methylcitrate dehydratase PrpD